MREFPEHAARIDRDMAAIIRGMLARGDQVADIAVWFGLNPRVVHAVQTSAVHAFLAAAPTGVLPPPGPYARARHVYAALADVHAAERRLFRLAASSALSSVE
jgi:hypothetical protein